MPTINGITPVELSIRDFQRIKKYLYSITGIHLSDAKISLVSSRLFSRMRLLNIDSFGSYFDYATNPINPDENTQFVDALTTNETYFFREPQHFDFLEQLLKTHTEKNHWRIWSGASSSGEEAYTIAMVIADQIGLTSRWSVIGTDLSSKVIRMAETGHYPLERNQGISQTRLKRYCLKGKGPQQGSFLVTPELRSHCEFNYQNLMEPCEHLEYFDVIFLRNVMIYFNSESKQKVLNNALHQLKSGGYFIISHTESLINMQHNLVQVQPSVFRKS